MPKGREARSQQNSAARNEQRTAQTLPQQYHAALPAKLHFIAARMRHDARDAIFRFAFAARAEDDLSMIRDAVHEADSTRLVYTFIPSEYYSRPRNATGSLALFALTVGTMNSSAEETAAAMLSCRPVTLTRFTLSPIPVVVGGSFEWRAAPRTAQ